MKKYCLKCNKEFTKRTNDSSKYWTIKKFCSKKCANIFNDNNRLKKGIARPQKVKDKMAKTQFKKGLTPWNKGKPYLQLRGKNHPRWKGGITPEIRKIRNSLEFKLWRKAIFERDNFTCVWCGKIGGVINADHIQKFSTHPELRFAIDNGRTLCRECHIRRHSGFEF